MAVHRVGILFCLAGCDAVFGLTSVQAHDAAGSCSRGVAFGAGELVPIGGMHSVEAVRLNPQQTLALIALADVSGSGPPDVDTTDIYQSTVTDHVIGGFSKLAGVSSIQYDSYPTFTADGQHIVLSSRRVAGSDGKSPHFAIWVATEANGGFDNATFATLDLGATGEVSFNEPYTLAAGDAMYFEGETTNDSNIYRASGGALAVGDLTPLSELNTTSRENAPVVSDDELEIFFASDRAIPDSTNLYGLDIYTAKRDQLTEPFGAPALVPNLSTADQIDYPVWLSPNGCELYYISKVVNVGSLYLARR
jgi:WD40-like Beta Propeller Repeat